MERVFEQEAFEKRMEREDYRALTPLFTSNINPYRVFTVDFDKPSLSYDSLIRFMVFIKGCVVAPNSSYVSVGLKRYENALISRLLKTDCGKW